MADLKIGVVGSGAVGGVIATILAESGFNVEMLYKHEDGLMMDNYVNMDVIGVFGEHSYLVKSVKSVDEFNEKKDVIFVTTRAYSVAENVKNVVPYLSENGIVVVAGNVLTYQDIRQYLPLSRVVSMFIEWSSVRISPCKIKVLSQGKTTIGIYDKTARPFLGIVKALLERISKVEISENMLEFTLSRIVMNSAISAIGAISGLRLGKFLDDKKGRTLFKNLINEAVMVFNELGVNIPKYHNQLDYYRFVDNTFKGKLYARKMMNLIKKNNGYLISSMLNDLDNGKKTEIDYLTGKICRLAKVKNVSVPYSDQVVRIVKEIEKGNRTIYKENIDEVLECAKN